MKQGAKKDIMTNEKPILFSTEMVKAILEGRKTMTRRIIKSRHESGLYRVCRRVTDNVITNIESLDWDERNCEKDITCRWQAGDALYVREEHYRKGRWIKNGNSKTGKQKWKFVATHPAVLFDHNKPALFEKSRNKEYPESEMWYKRLARFMPKSATRIWLQVTDIRVERLQDISEEDAKAEGIKSFRPVPGDGPTETLYYHYVKNKWGPSPIHSFETLWRSINGPESWQSNPFVFVISFKILSTGRAGEGKN